MTDTKDALIIFARRPEAGKVKTRLAATLGNEKALAIYIRLLEHTRNITLALPCDKHIFLTEQKHDAFWDGFTDELQRGEQLGDRMQHAFSLLFEKGYRRVMIIGTDCPHLTRKIIEDAFKALDDNDVVIGPATDGGYYLLGMNRLNARIFKNKRWSTDTVLADTIDDLKEEGLTYTLTPELSDVDEEKDVPAGWL